MSRLDNKSVGNYQFLTSNDYKPL